MGATTTIERPSRAMLEDRWEGLMLTANDPSELQEKLDDALNGIVRGILRRPLTDLNGDRDGFLLDELQKAIHDRVLAYAESEGE